MWEGSSLKLFAPLAAALARPRNASPSYPTSQQWGATPQHGYLGYARSYMTNEIVYAAVEMLATSAGEPHICGRKWTRNSPQIRNEEQRLLNAGIPRREVNQRLIRNGYYQPLDNHPLVKLLDKPNPWMSRGQMWGTVVMDRALAGNAYLLKGRIKQGPLRGAVGELWRMRPDRVKIIPSETNFIEAYEYNVGNDKIRYAAEDVLHFKTRNPLNDYYGMPPLMAAGMRVSIDEFMKDFLRAFYEKGGTGPGAVLSVKGDLSQEAKDEIRDRKNRMFAQPGGAAEWLILDNAESTFTPLGLSRGLRDALPKEIHAMQEAAIAMVFGIPGSILGLLIGYESSSYANKRQDWQVFWDLTMTPLLSDLDDVLNLQLVPDFGGIDEVMFDLSDIRALQEDVDKLHERARANWQAGGLTWRELREEIGRDPDVDDTEVILVPSNMTAMEIEKLGEEPEPVAPPQMPQQIEGPMDIVAEVHCPKCGRWVGRNMNVGAVAYCPKDKEVQVVRPSGKQITIDIVRDEEGRVEQLVGVK